MSIQPSKCGYCEQVLLNKESSISCQSCNLQLHFVSHTFQLFVRDVPNSFSRLIWFTKVIVSGNATIVWHMV